MVRPLADAAHQGPHPTTREFAELLERWGFKPIRGRQPDQHHRTLRGPHGGRIQLLASLQGRADAGQVARAARLAQVDLPTFLAGPAAGRPSAPGPDRGTGELVGPGPQPPTTAAAARPPRPNPARTSKARGDSVVALVLTTHARHDRPLRFDEVVDLCGGRVTRAQVSVASANLCRAGQVDRICEGVYQWAHGARKQSGLAPAHPPAMPPRNATADPGRPPSTAVDPVDELFARLFPDGVRMTPTLLRDLQRWTDLTRALAAHANS
jgi:hypothetical protein